MLLLFGTSCTLLRGYKKREFIYTVNNQPQRAVLLVPKGYGKETIITDSATGNKEQVYTYGGGMLLYFVQAVDTTKLYQFIDTTNHIPKLFPTGGLVYKGMDENGLYWREIRKDNFRAGYRGVSVALETKFDSALNRAGYVLTGE